MKHLLLLLASTLLLNAAGFKLTGSLAIPRYQHAATLLSSGRVLVTGGENLDTDFGFQSPFFLAAAELYDPDTESFRSLPSMHQRRSAHTATLLADGQVLIAGGSNERGPLSSAELFDPVKEVFVPVGNLTSPRTHHSAILLNNGKVLLTTGGHPAPAELYNPETRQFEPAGPYASGDGTCAVACSPAVKLNDGTVLIGATSPAQVYDPVSNTFRLLPQSSALGTASLLANGTVLYAGGEDFLRLQRAELYDPAKGRFEQIRDMLRTRVWHSSTLLTDGTVLLAGGEVDGMTGTTDTAEIYDPVTGEFRETGPMVFPRQLHTSTLLRDGSVLLAGGLRYANGLNYGSQSTVERYYPDQPGFVPQIAPYFIGPRSYPAILHGGTAQMVSAMYPPAPGEVIEIYCTGLLGSIPPEVIADGLLLEVKYSGEHANYPGLFQVNVVVPRAFFGMNLMLRQFGRTSVPVFVQLE